MNVRLFLAGSLVFLAGIDSDYERAWIVWMLGVAMIAASILRPLLAAQLPAERRSGASAAREPQRERIVRERQRESRTRYWHDDAA